MTRLGTSVGSDADTLRTAVEHRATVTWIRPELAWTTAPAPAGERWELAGDPSRGVQRAGTVVG